ncbi:MAG: HAD family hydrolase [Proteocatella sp.]
MYKLVSLDMDNTTLNNEHKISERNKKTLEKAHKKGVKIIINTGRTYYEAESFITELDFVDYAVVSNGSVVFDKNAGKFYQVNELDNEYVEVAHEICEKFKEDVLLLIAGETQCYCGNEYKDSKAMSIFEELIGIKLPFVENVVEYFENKFVGKAVVMGKYEILEKVKNEIEQVFGDRVQLKYSLECALEILSPQMDKSEGVKLIMDILNIKKEEVIAIGDGENDIGMLKQAALGIAVANACEPLKKVADYITLSNCEDGVAHAIEKFVLA